MYATCPYSTCAMLVKATGMANIFEALSILIISISLNIFVFELEIIFMIFCYLLIFPMLEIFNNKIVILNFESLDVKNKNEELFFKIKKVYIKKKSKN